MSSDWSGRDHAARPEHGASRRRDKSGRLRAHHPFYSGDPHFLQAELPATRRTARHPEPSNRAAPRRDRVARKRLQADVTDGAEGCFVHCHGPTCSCNRGRQATVGCCRDA